MSVSHSGAAGFTLTLSLLFLVLFQNCVMGLAGINCIWHTLESEPTGSEGVVITSPNYPSPYPPDLCQVWLYQGAPGAVFTLRILDLDMPGSLGACAQGGDYILVGPQPQQLYCGHSFQIENMVIYNTTVSNYAYIIFNSTGWPIKGKGFKARYQIIIPNRDNKISENNLTRSDDRKKILSSTTRSPEILDHTLLVTNNPIEKYLTGQDGECYEELYHQNQVVLLNGSYFSKLVTAHICTWKIQDEDNDDTTVVVWFRNCVGPLDRLYIFDSSRNLLHHFDSMKCPPNRLDSHSKTLTISYEYNGSGIIPSLAFSYQLVPEQAVPQLRSTTNAPSPRPESLVYNSPICDYTIYKPEGVLSSPFVSQYMLQRCGGRITWLVQASKSSSSASTAGGTAVHFSLKLTGCPLMGVPIQTQASLDVYDGNSSSAPILISCSRLRSGVSKGESFYVQYHTHDPDASDHFSLSFKLQESQCPKGTYSCGINSKFCYNENDRCNGKNTCETFKDEQDCEPSKCSKENGLFLCLNGRCIYEKWRCDGTADCSDNSDEVGCSLMTAPRVIVAAVVGSLTCALMLVLAVGCVVRVYRLRQFVHHHHRRSSGRAVSGCRRSGHCCHGDRLHYESPLTRQLAEMFRHRVPPPPYNEAMLTSRPYREVPNPEVSRQQEEIGNHGDSLERSVGGGRVEDSHRNGVRSTPANSENVADDVSLLQDSRESRRGRRSRRHHHNQQQQHRQIAQQDVPLSNIFPIQPQPIEVDSLPLVPGMNYPEAIGVDILTRLEEPPPYSEADPACAAAVGGENATWYTGSAHVGQSRDSMMLILQERRMSTSHSPNGNMSPISEDIESHTDSNTSSNGGREGHVGFVQHREGGEESRVSNSLRKEQADGGEDSCSLTGVSLMSVRVSSEGGGLREPPHVEEDSDSECILGTERNDEDKDEDYIEEDEEEDLEDDDEDGDGDSDDSDTACLLSAV